MSNHFPDGIPLDTISPFFKPSLSINPTEFNLFTGMNGSGKTLLLNGIISILHQVKDLREQGFQAIKEDRFYPTKLSYLKGPVALQNFVNTANIAPDTPEKAQLNEDLEFLFERKVDMIIDRSGNPSPNFRKKKANVHVGQDGRGIVNTWTIFEFVAHAPHNMPLVVEDISLGLHPSLLERFFDRLFVRLKEKDMQLFATTQDPFVVFYFLKNKIKDNGDWNDTNPEYSVFHFSDKPDDLEVEKITEENIYSSMSDLMGNFNESPDLQKFNLLFAKPNEE